MRKIYAHKLEGYKPCFIDFNENLLELRQDFELALTLPLDDI